MKVILSRKGFDSQYGCVPSPILPDGRMISLPIPDQDAPTRYDAIHRDGLNLGTVVVSLGGKRGKPAKPIAPTDLAHLDPDLDVAAVPRPPGWRPIFGQESAAFGHLRNQGVGPGDLLLFFGWFCPIQPASVGRWRYDRSQGPFHAIWGWMRVGAVHPAHHRQRWQHGPPDIRTCTYRSVSGIPCSWPLMRWLSVAVGGRRLPGAGLFSCKPQRILSETGKTPSNWRLPAWMHPAAGVATLSYNVNVERWTSIDEHSCHLMSAAKGQEFVLRSKDSDRQDAWLASLFADVDAMT